jgi:tRNA threonylcarbamoyladenosine biosynthesis protein TsaE
MAERAGPATGSSPPLDQSALEAWGRAVGALAVGGGADAVTERGGPPLVPALRGPLGAGKSVLARAVARGAGVEGLLPSPTYNLRFSYDAPGGVAVHHLDLYRLNDPDEVWELGWDELGEGPGLSLIEWPERAEALLPASRWDVYLDFVGTDPAVDQLRRLRLVRRGEPAELPPAPASPERSREAPPGGEGGE